MESKLGGAGYFLPGAWGCPPTFKSPKTGGHRGLREKRIL